jgi:very-short-patch-repair endonuclease
MSDRDQNTPFSEHMKARARQLRRDLTGPERVLWQALRAGRLGGWKIRRQVPFGPYVVDFFCHASSLAIEIDGDSHIDRAAPDILREAELRACGLRILRISNDDILKNLEGVLEAITKSLGQVDGNSPASPPGRGCPKGG